MARHQTLVRAANPFENEAENNDGSGVQPGYVVEWDSNRKVTTPSSAAAEGLKVVIDKYDVEEGGTYADGDELFFVDAKPGEQFYVQCDGSDTIAVGDFLEKTTSGTLKDTDSGAKVAVAVGEDDEDGTLLDGTSGKIVVERV